MNWLIMVIDYLKEYVSNMYRHNYHLARAFGALLLAAACLAVLYWVIHVLPKERVVGSFYDADGTFVIESEVERPLDSLMEKCSARFKVMVVRADSVRLVAVSKHCEFGNTSEAMGNKAENTEAPPVPAGAAEQKP